MRLPIKSSQNQLGARILGACCVIIGITFSSLKASTAGSPPDLLNYSGRLSNAEGGLSGGNEGQAAIASYPAAFRIYDAAVGGNILWAETQTVTVENGYFSVIIGEGAAIDGEPRPRLSEALAHQDTRYLGITFQLLESEAPEEMKPRQPLLYTPYAFLSASARKLLGADSQPVLSAQGNTLEVALPLTLTQALSGAALTGDAGSLGNLNASAISSGLLPAARLPATIPASSLVSGIFSDSQLPILSASKFTSIDVSNITSGRLPQSVVNTLDSNQAISFSSHQNFEGGIAFGNQPVVRHSPLAFNPVHLAPVFGRGWSFDMYPQTGLNSQPSYVSNSITHNEFVDLSVTVTGPGTLSFDWQVSSEPNYDKLIFLKGTSEVRVISGLVNESDVSVQVPTGDHTYSWQYKKDVSRDMNQDLGRVANILFTQSTVSAGTLVSPYNLALNRNMLVLRSPGDHNHFLAHGLDKNLNSRWNSPNPVNGAVLVGWDGGVLATRAGTSISNRDWTLRWKATANANDSNVEVRNNLRIRPHDKVDGSQMNYFGLFRGGNWAAASTAASKTTVALTSPGSIAALSFISASDSRIKEEVRDADPKDALAIVENLDFVEYHFKDQDELSPRVGLIAQQVHELDPLAVSLSQRFIPDLYCAPVSTHWHQPSGALSISLGQPHGLQLGEKVRLILPDSSIDLAVASIDSASSFSVKGMAEEPKEIFVYGRQVDDFHSIDLNRLFASGVIAVQEVQRRIQQSRDKLSTDRPRLEQIRQATDDLQKIRSELREALRHPLAAPLKSGPVTPIISK